MTVIGLGNPGEEYSNTRHNVGFMLLDRMSHSWKKGPKYLYSDVNINGEKTKLIKPMTYMNLSGEVFKYIQHDDIIVVYDDLDLPIGRLRIRKDGSAGGHNGIKSITEHLGTDAYPRFQIGIGNPARNNKAVVNHVLHAFQGEDKTAIEAAVAEMDTALEEWIKSGDIEEVMQAHNKKKAKAEKPAAE